MNRFLILTLLISSNALLAQAAPAPTATPKPTSKATQRAIPASTKPAGQATAAGTTPKATTPRATTPKAVASKAATLKTAAPKATPQTAVPRSTPAKAVSTKPTPAKPAPTETPATPVPTKAPVSTEPATATLHIWTPAKLFDPAALSQFTLPNGVRGIVRETHGTGLVSVQVWVKAGSRYEQDATNGASNLIETLAMEASQNYPRSLDGHGGPSDAIEALGGTAGSLTSRDSTFYNATVAASFLPAAIRALADATLHPRLADAAVEEAKFEVQTVIQARERDPLSAVVDLAYRATFVKHPYKRPANGTPASVENLTPAHVRQFFKERYVGANISVVIVGDVTRTTARKLIEQAFGQAPAATAKPYVAPLEIAPKTNRVVTRQRPINRSAVALAFRSPGIASEKDVVAMDVLLAYWREGSNAALRKVLLGNAKTEDAAGDDNDATPQTPPLAVGFDVDYLTQYDPGLFVISLVVEPENRSAAVKATLGAITAVQTNGLDTASLRHAQHALAQQYIQQSETVSGQAGALGFYEMIKDYRFAVTYLDRINRVTSADIQRVATKYLSRSAYIQVVIEPSPLPPGSGGVGNTGSITARTFDHAATDSKG